MNKFSLNDILTSYIGYKGIIYPGAFFPDKPARYQNSGYEYPGEATEKAYSDLGSMLRKKDAQGRWYFMPVVLEHKGGEYEIPNAVISINGKKTVVETAMIGRKGTVKELISVDDYEINIAGVALDSDFPDQQIARLNELYNINEAVTLKCALTDIFLEEEDKVVIKSIDFQEMRGCETAQAFKMGLVTDRSFELILE